MRKIAQKPLFTDIPRPTKFNRVPAAQPVQTIEPKAKPIEHKPTTPSMIKLDVPEITTGGEVQAEPKHEDKGTYVIENLDLTDYK